MSTLSKLLGSSVRAEILRILFGLQDREFHLRDIQRRAGLATTGIRRELINLAKLDLIVARRDGNRLYYGANTIHPLYRELRSIVLKTSGMVDVLIRALSAAPPNSIRCAFVFGSFARREEKSRSDVDLMVIGNLGLRAISPMLRNASNEIGREINPHTFTVEEYRKRLASKDHFLTSVLETERIFVIGTEDDLKQLGEKRLAEDA